MRKSVLSLSIAAALAVPAIATAQQAQPPKPSVPTLDQVFEASGIAVDGYIDAGYSRLSGTGKFTSGFANRAFDTEPNSFLLHQAATKLPQHPKQALAPLAS